MIDVAYYLFNAFGISTQPGRLMLPKWVNISEKKFNEILSTITEAKNNRLKVNVDGREITLDKADDVKKLLNRPMITRNQENMVKNFITVERNF